MLRAIRLLEATGALLTQKEIEGAHESMPDEVFQPAENRNSGYISISKEGIAHTQEWEEAHVEIDLTEEIISFDLFFLDSKESYIEENELEEADCQSPSTKVEGM